MSKHVSSLPLFAFICTNTTIDNKQTCLPSYIFLLKHLNIRKCYPYYIFDWVLAQIVSSEILIDSMKLIYSLSSSKRLFSTYCFIVWIYCTLYSSVFQTYRNFHAIVLFFMTCVLFIPIIVSLGFCMFEKNHYFCNFVWRASLQKLTIQKKNKYTM